jgi:hypothetical protein
MSSSSTTISSSKPPPPQHHLLRVDTNNNSSSSPVVLGSAYSSHHSSPRTTAGGGGGSCQNQACAACKYQRRKCNPDCPLARYFPADQQRRFLNAHRLFGVSNIQKTLRRIDPEYGPEAMRALIYQSEARAVDPVYGCVRIIKQLEHEIQVLNAELTTLRHQIAIYRQAAAAAGDHHQVLSADPVTVLAATGQDNVTMDALYAGAADQEQLPVHHQAGAGFVVVHDQQQQHYNNALDKAAVDDHHQQQAPLYDYFCYDGTAGDEATSHDATVQEYCYSDSSVVVKAGSSLTSLGEQLENHYRIEAAPFLDAFDVKPYQDLLPVEMAEQHHGHIEQQLVDEKKAAAAVVKYDDDADHKLAAAAPATAQCHLELGFSSY